MADIDALLEEQELLTRMIQVTEEYSVDSFALPASLVADATLRLAIVNRQIDEHEGPTDHGGWEDH